MRYAALILLFLCNAAAAQYSGPAVNACLDYAKREQKQEIVIERDQSLLIERYTKKVGNQFVSSILTGNGAVVYEGAPSAELAFICLLASDRQAVFFEWMPRVNVPAAMHCLRHESLRKNQRACYDLLLRVAEQDLTLIYAERFQEANQRGEAALAAFRKSNDEWRQYRDAECARRRDFAPAGVSPDDYVAACGIELTRRRVQDMR